MELGVDVVQNVFFSFEFGVGNREYFWWCSGDFFEFGVEYLSVFVKLFLCRFVYFCYDYSEGEFVIGESFYEFQIYFLRKNRAIYQDKNRIELLSLEKVFSHSFFSCASLCFGFFCVSISRKVDKVSLVVDKKKVY